MHFRNETGMANHILLFYVPLVAAYGNIRVYIASFGQFQSHIRVEDPAKCAFCCLIEYRGEIDSNNGMVIASTRLHIKFPIQKLVASIFTVCIKKQVIFYIDEGMVRKCHSISFLPVIAR